EQVKRSPDAVALVFEERCLTYKALNGEANRLARYLRKHYAIKPDALIAIRMERSLELVVALLGVLKSGAAYVPIDVSYPKERVQYILDDTKALLVLEDDFFKTKPYLNESSRNVPSMNSAKDLAYVIYTSGTTGKPKGVMVEH
ncbi:AMP-binding protein, partial [Legionella oakridgensis]|uniref:AMP-binding protein n=1 Tax=Legionella oakridgensis TaxID=29423 RepID=UPI00055BF24D